MLAISLHTGAQTAIHSLGDFIETGRLHYTDLWALLPIRVLFITAPSPLTNYATFIATVPTAGKTN